MTFQASAGWYQQGNSWKYVASNWHALLSEYEASNPKPISPSKPGPAPGHKGLFIFDSRNPGYDEWKTAKAAHNVAYRTWSGGRTAWVNAQVQKDMIATKPAAADMNEDDKIRSGEYGDDYSVHRPGPVTCSDLSLGGPPANPCNGRPQGTVVSSAAKPAPKAADSTSNKPATEATPTSTTNSQTDLNTQYIIIAKGLSEKYQNAIENLDCTGLSNSMCIKLKERIVIDMQLALKSFQDFFVALGADINSPLASSSNTASTTNNENDNNESTEETSDNNENNSNSDDQDKSRDTASDNSSASGICVAGNQLQCPSTSANAKFTKTCNSSGSAYGRCVFSSCKDGFTAGLSFGGPPQCERSN